MDYWKIGVAVGCVLLLVWGIETWLNRIVCAIEGVSSALRATYLQAQEFERKRLSELEYQRFRERNAKAMAPKWGPVLDDTNLATPARELIDKMSAKTHAATGLPQKATDKP